LILTKRGEDVSEFSRVNSSVAVLVEDLETLDEIFVGARIVGGRNGPEDWQVVLERERLVRHVFLCWQVFFVTAGKEN
jgi:hypothetical protein